MADQNMNRKERISERYKGVDPSVLEVIPAKPIDEINVADRTLKVAAYVRVSTENDEQKSSYELQVNDFTDRIKGNPNWEFAGIYSDEERSYPVLFRGIDFHRCPGVICYSILSLYL